ncbi:hypothetical protein POTOM_043016 [Populus tomentosa]|uniref:Cytochrome b/b6 N-terminal region profile domain-containing protein n=1 Tax=Populus tomentosa TaxID=118781 RepID=A0A8X7YR25_POPTO|nr:hypothetical protein POTOM_043016 [Populus tomentosa]
MMVLMVLAVLTASFGVTGYSLPWGQIGYWAVKIVTGVPEAIPVSDLSILGLKESSGSPTCMCRLGAHQKQELLPCQLAQDLKDSIFSTNYVRELVFHATYGFQAWSFCLGHVCYVSSVLGPSPRSKAKIEHRSCHTSPVKEGYAADSVNHISLSLTLERKSGHVTDPTMFGSRKACLHPEMGGLAEMRNGKVSMPMLWNKLSSYGMGRYTATAADDTAWKARVFLLECPLELDLRRESEGRFHFNSKGFSLASDIDQCLDWGGVGPRENVCRCDHESKSKHSAVDRQTLPKHRPQMKDGEAPVPRVGVFPIMSLLRSELVDSLSLIGRPALSNLRISC